MPTRLVERCRLSEMGYLCSRAQTFRRGCVPPPLPDSLGYLQMAAEKRMAGPLEVGLRTQVHEMAANISGKEQRSGMDSDVIKSVKTASSTSRYEQ